MGCGHHEVKATPIGAPIGAPTGTPAVVHLPWCTYRAPERIVFERGGQNNSMTAGDPSPLQP